MTSGLLDALGLSFLDRPDLSNPLNAIQQANPYYGLNVCRQATPSDIAYYERLERERLYRSVSQNWLNAMIDIEIGA
jgi:hypothetical protein